MGETYHLAKGRFNYWAGFVLLALLIPAFLLYGLRMPVRLSFVVVFLVFGYLSWGLVEYVFHRFLYHHPQSPGYEGHMAHHDDVTAFIAMPWFIVALILGVVGWLLSLFIGMYSLFFLAGLATGYLWYGILHHAEHHLGQKIPLKKLWAYHNIHHKLPHTNYGVTTRFWDIVFGTHYQAHKYRLENTYGYARVRVENYYKKYYGVVQQYYNKYFSRKLF